MPDRALREDAASHPLADQRYRQLLAALPAAVYTCDPDGVITWYNHQAAELWGRSPQLGDTDERFCGSLRLYRMDGSPLPRTHTPMAVALREGGGCRGQELIIERPGGSRVTVSVHIDPLRDEQGRLCGAVNVFTDIGEREPSEAAIRNAASFPEENPNPVLRACSEGRVLYANGPARVLLAAMDCPGALLLPPVLQEAVGRTLARSEPLEVEVACAGRVFSFILSPSKTEGWANLYGRDISERKQAEEALTRTSRRYALLSETAAALLSATDPQALVQGLCGKVMEHLECDVFFNFLVDEDAQRLRLNACAGIPPEQAEQLRWLDYGTAVCGCVARERRPIVAEDIQNRPDPRTDLIKSYGVQACCCHPLLAGERLIGTLSFGTRHRPRFSDHEVEMMRAVTGQVAVALERIRAERELRDSELFHRQTLESIPGMVFTTRPDGYCDYQSQQWVAYTGVPMVEHLGDGWNRLLHPEDRARAYAAWREAVAGDAPYDLEYRVRRRDGQYEWFKVVGRPIRDESGQIARWFGVAINIEHLKQADEALRESEERARLAVAAGRMGTWDWRVHTEEVTWSEGLYRVLGYLPGELQPSYQAFRGRVHPQDLQREDREIREAMEEHREYRCEFRVVWPNGSIHWLEARGRYLYDESGTALRMFGVVLDIDERVRLQEQKLGLLEAERAARMEFENVVRLKDEFLATVSHELRSPLSAIVGWTGLLAKGKADPVKAADIIRRSASSLTQLVEDLLDMSRIISGKLRLKCERVNLCELVNNAVEAVQCAAEAKAIDVDVAFDPHLGDVECDPNRIQQIIWNLLTNAIKFTPERGQVHLEVSHWPGQVAISVQDTGKGIAPGFLPHLFDRFRQEDGGIARKHGGLGLGLSIVKHLVELHGGTVEAHSAGEGQGSTFLVKLPRSPAVVEEGDLRATFARPARVGLAALDERSLWGVRVLGVDDDLSSRELLVRVLSDAGATVRAADSARSAWAMLDEFRPDVLISDVGMPEEDGLVFVKRLRATGGRYAQLPVVAVTAFGRPEDRDAALQAGFDEHMSKPFDPGLLCAMIRELAGGSGKPAVVPLANGISTGP